MYDGQKLALAIADHIELYPDSYNQGLWGVDESENNHALSRRNTELLVHHMTGIGSDECGTPACVAGWAIRLAPPGALPDPDEPLISAAIRLLDLDSEEALWLFSACRHETVMPAVLRHYAATGEVDPSIEDELLAPFHRLDGSI